MKRTTLIGIFSLAAVLFGGGPALYAQHGGIGVGGAAGAAGGLGGGIGAGHGDGIGLDTHAGADTNVGAGVGAGGHSVNTNTNAHANTGASIMTNTNPGDVLDHNDRLSSNLEGTLGLSGPTALATLKTDASGFKNFGQFMAAAHASHNLGIPFADLQARMTGAHAVSLGKAIQTLRPNADVKNEVKKANAQAKADADVKSAATASAS